MATKIKVVNPHTVTFLIMTPTFEWFVILCGSKSEYHKNMCFEEIGLLALNMVTDLGSIVNIIEGTYIMTI